MGYVDYFLIVWDYCRYARSVGIAVGPGRGSAAGSLVSYTLGITKLDPIRFNLLFERFLNPERVSMPDMMLTSATSAGRRSSTTSRRSMAVTMWRRLSRSERSRRGASSGMSGGLWTCPTRSAIRYPR